MKIKLFTTLICWVVFVSNSSAEEPSDNIQEKDLINIYNISTKDLDKDVAKALRQTQKLISQSRKEKDSDTEFSATKQWCLLLHNYNFLEQAKDCYFAVGMKEKQNAKWPYLYGKAALEQGNIADALKGFQQAVVRDKYYLPAHYYLIELARQAGELKLAFGYMSQVPVELVLNSKMLLLNGDLYFETENYYIAIGFYLQALNLVPNAKSINYKIAQAYNVLGEAQKAQAYLQLSGESGIQLNDPYYFEVKNTIVGEIPHLIEAKAALSNKSYKQAIESYKKALEFNPSSKTALTNIAVAYFRDGQTQEAKQRFLEILKSQPQNAIALFNLAGIYLSENSITEAVRYYEHFREINPSDETVNLNLIKIYYQSHEYQKVLDVVSDKSMSTHEQAQVYKAKALINLKKYKEAISLLKTIHKYKPENQETLLLLVKLLTQLSDKSLRNPQEALEYAEKAVSKNSNLQSLWQLAMALDENGQCERVGKTMDDISVIIKKSINEVYQQFSLQRGEDFKCRKNEP